MADRITDKHMQALADRMNKLTGSPATPYAVGEDNRSHAQVGNFHISHAYGGVCLHRMSNTSGGVSCPLGNGYGTKRELYDSMHAWLRGHESAKNGTV